MSKTIQLLLSLSVILFLNGCSSVKVLNSWKGDNMESIKDKNIIVIARTSNKATRTAFENEIVDQLTSKGIKSSTSISNFPDLNPDQEVTDEQREKIKSLLLKEGFNAVVLTVIKEIEELSRTTKEGGHYAGGNYMGYYPKYYGVFVGYYQNPSSFSSYGNYVEESFSTQTANNFVLETVIYNLDESEEKQLVAVVASKIEDPENATSAAKQYVKAITKSFD